MATRRREQRPAELHGGRRGRYDPEREESSALSQLGNAGSAALLAGDHRPPPTAAQVAAVQRLAGNAPASLLAVQRDGEPDDGGSAGELELSGLPVLPVLSATFGTTVKAKREYHGAERGARLEPAAQTMDNLEITRKPDAASAAVQEQLTKDARSEAKDAASGLDGTLRLTQRGKHGNVSAGAFTIKGAQLIGLSSGELERLELAVEDFGQAEATKATARKASAQLVVDGWDAPIPLLTASGLVRTSEIVQKGGSFDAKHIGAGEIEPLKATVALGPAVGKLKAAMPGARLTMTFKHSGGYEVKMLDCLVTEVVVHATGGGSAPTASIAIQPEQLG